MAVQQEKRLNADDFYEAVRENNELYELFDGVITALASPSILHQVISREVSYLLIHHVKTNKGNCSVFTAPTDVKLDDNNVVVPDIFVACDNSRFDKQKFNGAPDLIIEITSSDRYNDFYRKLLKYREAGVREYWIIDPENEKTLVYHFERSDFPTIYPFDKPIPVGIWDNKLEVIVADLL